VSQNDFQSSGWCKIAILFAFFALEQGVPGRKSTALGIVRISLDDLWPCRPRTARHYLQREAIFGNRCGICVHLRPSVVSIRIVPD
jgi:hypothetical protein